MATTLLDLVTGLDDIATECQLTSGWSFVALPKPDAAQFAAQAQRLLPASTMEFHAKELNAKDDSQCRAYEDFLSLLRQTAEGAPASLLACSLNDQVWHNGLTDFVSQLVPNVFAPVGVTDKNVLDRAISVVSPLFTLTRLLNRSLNRPSAVLTSLEIDQDTETARLASDTVSVNGNSMPATHLLALLADATASDNSLLRRRSVAAPFLSLTVPHHFSYRPPMYWVTSR